MSLTEKQIAEMLVSFERLLRSARPVEVDWVVGLNRYTDDGAWEQAEPNGSITVTIRVDGGAHETRETWPRNLPRLAPLKEGLL